MHPAFLITIAALILPSALEAQQKKGRCNGAPPDSTWLLKGPVYRDCEVDRKAELRGAEPRPDYQPVTMPRPGCLRAEFEFVVDTSGALELETIRAKSGNDRGLEEAIQRTLPLLRYTPARLGDQPVRQLVVYKRSAVIRVVSSADPVRTPARPPTC